MNISIPYFYLKNKKEKYINNKSLISLYLRFSIFVFYINTIGKERK